MHIIIDHLFYFDNENAFIKLFNYQALTSAETANTVMSFI